jgi:acid stress chaperone HdeB
MRACLTILGGLVVLLSSAPAYAQAQIVIDASKITCEQFVHSKVGNPRTVAAWLSGFYHGQKGATTVDMTAFDENVDQLQKFCYDEKNFNVRVMDAIERETKK